VIEAFVIGLLGSVVGLFLGLGLADPVPDANTIWTFREALTKAGAIEVLFRRFDKALKMSGYLAMGGQIVDATIVAAPKQRNTDEEKKVIKEGRVPDAMEGQACQARPEGSRRALDGQILQSQAACGWHAAGGSRHSRFRIQEPRLDRSLPWTDPEMDGYGRRCL